jgi:hemoglobin
VEELDVYSLVGESGLTRLVAAFYRRVPQDDILGSMYPPHDLAGAERRLRDFLVYRLGGPPRYIKERGHPRLRVRHAPFHINQSARERWMQLMTAALEEVAFPPEADQFLRTFLGEIATFLINRAGSDA